MEARSVLGFFKKLWIQNKLIDSDDQVKESMWSAHFIEWDCSQLNKAEIRTFEKLWLLLILLWVLQLETNASLGEKSVAGLVTPSVRAVYVFVKHIDYMNACFWFDDVQADIVTCKQRKVYVLLHINFFLGRGRDYGLPTDRSLNAVQLKMKEKMSKR